MTPREITSIACKMLQAQGSFQVLSLDERKQLARYPEVQFLARLLQANPPGSWDRLVHEFLYHLSPGQAIIILNDIFSPQGEIPPALVRIYDVIENTAGVIVSFNYDGIDELQSRFSVIAPHGRRPKLLSDPVVGSRVRRLLENSGLIVPTDWHLPVAEEEIVRDRPDYQKMLQAWRRSHTIVFIGYAFGGGADALSFEDFGQNTNLASRVHVLCPRPDNTDLCRQIGYVLQGRRRGFRIFGQPFRWKAFAEAVLEVLGAIRAGHIRFAIGKEAEIAMAHDRL